MTNDSIVPKESVATPEDVKKFLALTPEQVEELQREQKLLLYRSRARLTDNERRVARGIELEQHYLLTGNKDGLAEALKLQGRYAEAADAAVNTELKAELTELAGAVEKNDRDCDCDSFLQQGQYTLPSQYVEIYGNSLKHGGEIPFIRCTICGDLNARSMLPHLNEQRAIRDSDRPDSEKLKFFKK